MKLLVVNDDGISAEGIYTLAKELEKYHDVTIVAPEDQKSASSQAITIERPLIVKEVVLEGLKSKAYSVDGTPADCTRIGIDKLVDKPDMVISGINRGVNLGNDILYSGTVSAAIEAAVNKIPSLAISVRVKNDIVEYEVAAKYASKVIELASKNKLEEDIVLNLNVPLIPEKEIKGIKVCRMGGSLYNSFFIKSNDEKEIHSYTLRGTRNEVKNEDTDIYYFKEGYVTLTPLHYDLTNFSILKVVEDWVK